MKNVKKRRDDSNPIPLEPPVTSAVIPCKHHLLLLLPLSVSPIFFLFNNEALKYVIIDVAAFFQRAYIYSHYDSLSAWRKLRVKM